MTARRRPPDPEKREGGSGGAALSKTLATTERTDNITVHSSPSTFDWNNDKSVCIHEQPTTAVYTNDFGQLVIRQHRAWDQDEDPLVIIDRAHLNCLIDMLQVEARS